MPEVTWTHPFLPKILNEIPGDTKTLVDVGCGRGIIGALMRIYREPLRTVGIDIYHPDVEFCRKSGFYDELYCQDLRNLPLPFEDKSFDVATCIEVIEHLSKKDGQKLLHELERLANLVLVTTPNRFFSQPKQVFVNPSLKHLSRWAPSDFIERGYTVEGFGDFLIRGKRFRYVSAFLAPLCRRRVPHFAYLFLAKKRTK